MVNSAIKEPDIRSGKSNPIDLPWQTTKEPALSLKPKRLKNDYLLVDNIEYDN
jgi:hypothetical protein